MSATRSGLACFALLLAAIVPQSATAQERVIPPGKETLVLDAVRAAFGESSAGAVAIDNASIRVDTGEGPILVATAALGAATGVAVTVECEHECGDAERNRWSSVAERLRISLVASESELWVTMPASPRQVVRRSSGPTSAHAGSWLLVLLVVAGLVGAPRHMGSSHRACVAPALVGVGVFALLALTLSPPRPLHDHLCFVERAWCASTLTCDVVHDAWGRPTFHLMGLFLAPVPHRLSWILGVGVGITSLALFFVFDVTSRLARNLGGADLEGSSGQAGLWALLVTMHPGLLRVAGAGSFWPLTMLLVFISLHLLLRAGDTAGPRQTLALIAAGAAFALVLGGNRIVLVLAPLMIIAPWSWRARWPGGFSLAHGLALALPIAMFLVAAHAVLNGSVYDVWRSRPPGELLASFLRVPYRGALSWSYTAPPVGAIALVALASRRRFRAVLPVVYAFVALTTAALHFAGPLDWRAYPDIYIKHFPQLLLVAPLFGIGALIVIRHVQKRSPRGARFVVPLCAVVLLLGAWTRPDARNLLFEQRVMEREVAALQAAFDVLPAHEEIVTLQLSAPPAGIGISGDPLEMHFPTGMYRAAMEARGMQPAPVTPFEALTEQSVADRRVLLHVGGVLRSFYPAEISSGSVPSTLERPELVELRTRFDLEPAHLFEVPTQEPSGVGNRVAPGAQTVQLGFYWLTERRAAP